MIRLHVPSFAVVAIALLWAFSMAPVRADDTSPHPRAALVIGNGGYTNLNLSTSAANDGHDMCQALTSLGYSAACFEDVKDAREFKARIQDFTSSLKPRSELVFYYAGHAIQVKGENYLVPTTARPRTEVDVPKETISLAYIMAQLLQGKHYLNIVILDACRGTPWQGDARGMTAGLAPITTIPRGTMVMYGTAPVDYAEQSSARNGVLTKHLLANIATPGLTADEFFRKVSEGVQSDSGDAATSAQSAALYTNFTGEFCFGGCIDKVARAELEKIEKENEEQLEQTRKQRAELEARKREAQAKLLEAAIVSNCDRSVLGDSGRCFSATPEAVTKAVVTAFTQRGFMRPDSAAVSGAGPDSWWVSTDVTSDEPLWAMRITDNVTDKNVSDIVRISVTQRNVTSISRCVVTLSATRRTVLHDEFHTWGAITIVPVATSKQYRDVVKNEVDITDSAFYQDLLAAIERNVRGINAGAGQAVDGATAITVKEAVQLSDHERRYDAAPDRTQRALIAALVGQGYLIRSVHPEFASIDLFRRLQDAKNKHSSIISTLAASVTTPATGAGSQAQLSGHEVVVAYIEPGGTMMGTLSGDSNAKHESYETRLVHESAVTDANFYRGLFASTEAVLHGESVPSKHSLHLSGSTADVLARAAEVLPQHGFQVTGRDERLGILQLSKRAAIPLSGNDGWTAHYVEATVYADTAATNETVVYVAASSQDAIFHAAKTVSYAFLIGARYHSAAVRDCRARKCTIEELEARFAGAVGTGPRSLETLTHEGDADAAAYGEVLSIVSQKPSSGGH